MNEVDAKTINVDDLTTPQPGGGIDPGYEAWATRKIERALKHDRANPDKRLTQEQMWEKYGLAR